MKDLERDGRDSDSRSGLWFLLLIVSVGSALQFVGMPSTGSAAPAAVEPIGAKVLQEPVTGRAAQDAAPEQSVSAIPTSQSPAATPRSAAPQSSAPVRRPAPAASRARRSAAPPAAAPMAARTRGVGALPPATQATQDQHQEPAPPEAAAAAGNKSAAMIASAPVVLLTPPAVPKAIVAEPDEIADPKEPAAPAEIDGEGEDQDRGRNSDPEPEEARIVVIGPTGVRPRDFVTFTLAAENVKGLAHAPIRLSFDAEVLEFVSGEAGGFLASDGAQTQFMIAPGETPGTLDIALSRMAPAGGIDGSGVLATVTFLARGPGMSPIITAGSRYLDVAARGMALRSDDAYVSVQ